MPLSKGLREFIECLISNEVEYVIVGALAVSWHGFSRFSSDIDLFFRPNLVNAERLLAAIRQFGFGSLTLHAEDFLAPGRVIQLGYEPNRIDLLTSISGIEFEEAWSSRVQGEIDGLRVQILGRDALLRNKSSTGRLKDRIDVEALGKIKKDDTR